MAGDKSGNLALDRLGQNGAGPVAQNFGEMILENSWLDKLEDIMVRHGISTHRWRSGGVKPPTICRIPDSRRH